MKTDDLILELTRNLKPVKKINSVPITRLISFSCISILTFLAFYFLSEKFHKIHFPVFIHETFILFFIFLISFDFSIKLTSPVRNLKNKFASILILYSLLCMSLVFRYFFQIQNDNRSYEYHSCGIHFASLSLIGVCVLGILLFNRFYGENENLNFYTSTAIVSISAFSTLFLCPDETPHHLFFYHLLPILPFTLLYLGIFSILQRLLQKLRIPNFKVKL